MSYSIIPAFQGVVTLKKLQCLDRSRSPIVVGSSQIMEKSLNYLSYYYFLSKEQQKMAENEKIDALINQWLEIKLN
jgi:hypothetical protein